MTILDHLRYDEAMKTAPFHMPGHKRNSALLPKEFPVAIDITEIEGMDNLHDPQGIISQAEQRASDLYGSNESYYLINGSSCGILSAICACADYGDRILIARNCHRSIYHAIELRGLTADYLVPMQDDELGICGSITPNQVERALQSRSDYSCIVLVSPSYEGICCDIKSISELTRAYGIPLIVDEAHGAHLGFHPYFPKNSLRQGADLVVHSLHKTLPSLTQTALLHRNSELVPVQRIRHQLQIFQSSSPSYILMSSMDACVELLKTRGEAAFSAYVSVLESFYQSVADLRHLRVVRSKNDVPCAECFDFDRSKLLLSAAGTNMSGSMLKRNLSEKFSIEMEMSGGSYVVGMSSIADRMEDFEKLSAALRAIDTGLEAQPEKWKKTLKFPSTEAVTTIAQATAAERKMVTLRDAKNEISSDYIFAYPPGIPLVVPGERLTMEMLEYLVDLLASDVQLKNGKNIVSDTLGVLSR